MRNTLFYFFIKLFLTTFVTLLIPIYWYYYGLHNFLWVSDISLFLTTAALWLSSSFIMSVAIVSFLVFELLWNIDFILLILFKKSFLHITGYMADTDKPLFLRGLSLFHCIIPVIWIIYLKNYGYHKRALYYAPFLLWALIAATYFFTDPQENINFVFNPPWAIYILILAPFIIFLPTHYFLKYLDN